LFQGQPSLAAPKVENGQIVVSFSEIRLEQHGLLVGTDGLLPSARLAENSKL
jgi:hypothetical protein